MIATGGGIDNVDRNLIRRGQSLSGCRDSSLGLAAAEMIGATYDIGVYKLIAGVAILSMLGLTVAWLIGKAEKYFLTWRT